MTVRVLETTIRDGGYEISHQFTEEDVALVVSTLESAGVSFIEIGYGMGVGAHLFPTSTRPKEPPVAGDRAHMNAGRASARRAKIGVLFGAGDIFCPPEYLDEVAAAGMDFVRLAFMPGDVTPANMRYVERGKALGLIVSINCMQTYILPPAEIARIAAMSRSAGCDWWYVVDSAGGMQPAEIRDYVRAVRDASDIEVGVHCHNNLGLAVANSLAAVEAGATLVDSTLNGLGRATGNAPTEQLVLALQSLGHEPDIDLEPIARLSSMYRVLFEDKGNSPMNFVSGASMLHSRNVPAVIAQAKERGLSVADFLVRVGKEARVANCLDRFAFPPEVFERAAAECKRSRSGEPSDALVTTIAGRISAREHARIESACEDLAVRAARHHVPSVLHVVPDDVYPLERALPWQSRGFVGVTAPWSEVTSEYRRPDYLLVDTALAGHPKLPACRRRAFTCAWTDLWKDAIRAAVAAAAAVAPAGVWLPTADDARLRRLADRLTTAGFTVTPERPDTATAIVVATGDIVARLALRAGDRVVLVDRGAAARKAVDTIRAAGAHALAPAIAQVIAGRVEELVTVATQLTGLLDEPAGPWVDVLLAPGSAQAVVDVDHASIIETNSRPLPELTTQLARARAVALARGTGKP